MGFFGRELVAATLAVGLGACVARPEHDDDDGTRPVPLTCRPGADPSWVGPGAPRAASRAPTPPPGGVIGTVWCSGTAELRDGDALWVLGIGAPQVFLGGEPLAAARPSALGLRTSGERFPVSSPPAGDRISMRLDVETRFTWQSGPNATVRAGPAAAIETAQLRASRDALHDATPNLLARGAALVLGLGLLAFHLRRPGLEGNLALGVGATAYGALVAESLVHGDVLPLFFGFRSYVLTLTTVAYVGLFAAGVAAFGGSRRFVLAWGVAMAARSAFMLGWPATAHGFALAHTAVVLVPAAGYALALAVRGLRAVDPGQRILAGSLLTFLVVPVAWLVEIAGFGPEIVGGSRAVAILATTLWIAGVAWSMTVERVVRALEEVQQTYVAAARFVPDAFLRSLGRATVRDAKRGDARRAVFTVMFLDLRRFTTLAEGNSPEAVFELINELMGIYDPIVRDHRGFIAQNTGDGFVALFPDAPLAVAAAHAIQAALRARTASGSPFPVQAGIGLHTGPILLGTVGGGGFLSVGLVGDTVNVAARIEGLTKLYDVDVLASDATAPGDGARGLVVDEVVVKGRADPIRLVALAPTAWPSEIVASFAAGQDAYARGAFDEAAEIFEGLSPALPAAGALARRCRSLAQAPPAAWDGIWRLDHK